MRGRPVEQRGRASGLVTARVATRWEIGLACVGGLAIILFLYASLFTRPASFGWIDHDHFNTWQLAVSESLRRGHLLHWMPYLCGGQPGVGNPQSGALSPFNVLGLWLSPVMQFKIEMVLNALGGLAGFVALAVWSGARPAVALVGLVIWAGNAVVAIRVLHGQRIFLSLFLLPALVALVYREARDPGRRWPRLSGVAWGAAVMLLILYQDGYHTILHAMPLLLALALGWSGRGRGTAPLTWLAGTSLLAGALALPRMLPVAMFVRETPRVPPDIEFIAPGEALFRLIDPDLQGQIHAILREGTLYRLGFIGHVGILPLALFAVYLLLGPRRASDDGPSRWPWLVAFVLAFALSLGDLGPLSPWHHLRALPLLKMIRAPYKFQVSLALAVACCAQLAVSGPAPDWLSERLPALRSAGRALLGLLVLSLVGIMAASLWPLFDEAQQPYEPPFNEIDETRPFTNARTNDMRMYEAVSMNMDVVNCREATTRHSMVPAGTPLAALARGLGKVSARLEPNRIVVDYDAPRDTVLHVFQNWDAGWTRDLGDREEPVERHSEGFMKVHVRAGTGRVVLRFRPIWFHRGLEWSAGIMALLVLLSALYARWRGSSDRPEGA